MDISKDQQYLIAELSHQINSPLAAIRNAVYLACCQTEDPLLQRYLRIADEEITVIATILRATRAIIEERGDEPNTSVHTVASSRRAATA
jgi:signal transduction histidine kinase